MYFLKDFNKLAVYLVIKVTHCIGDVWLICAHSVFLQTGTNMNQHIFPRREEDAGIIGHITAESGRLAAIENHLELLRILLSGDAGDGHVVPVVHQRLGYGAPFQPTKNILRSDGVVVHLRAGQRRFPAGERDFSCNERCTKSRN